MMTVMNLDKLEVWIRANDFALSIDKEEVPHLPVDEKWNRTQQLKRAAQSHMTLAHESGYLSDEIYKRMTLNAESIDKQLNNHIAYLQRSRQGEKDYPGYALHEETEPYLLDDQEEQNR